MDLTIDGPNSGAADEIRVLPVCGLQLPALLEIVFLRGRWLGFETTRLRHFRVCQRPDQEARPRRRIKCESDGRLKHAAILLASAELLQVRRIDDLPEVAVRV